VIVDHGNTPSLLYSLFMVAVGCAGVLLLLAMLVGIARSAD
jgi:NADH:ubiquinone oxidoreductase subunit 6 (subunit J)